MTLAIDCDKIWSMRPRGMEDEIAVLINALLPTLPVPQSAELFTG